MQLVNQRKILSIGSPFLGGLCLLWGGWALNQSEQIVQHLCGMFSFLGCFYLILNYRNLKTHAFNPTDFLKGVFIGVGFEILTASLNHNLHLPVSIISDQHSIPQSLLVGICILSWWLFLKKAIENRKDPLVCYSFWPNSSIFRLLSLLTYYASSNSLLLAANLMIWIPIVQSIPIAEIGKIPTFAILFIFLFLKKTSDWISHSQYHSFTKEYHRQILAFFWIINLIMIWTLTHGALSHHWKIFQDFSLSTYKREFFIFFYHPFENHIDMIPLTFRMIWVPCAGSAAMRFCSFSIPSILGLSMGLFSSVSVIHFLGPESTTIISMIILFSIAFFSQSPIHIVDAPWQRPQRIRLKMQRWLLIFVLIPWFIFLLDFFYGSQIWIALMNQFGFLILVSMTIQVLVLLIEKGVSFSKFESLTVESS